MNRRLRSSIALALCGLVLFSGCHPVQPFYFKEDGDLSHYKGVATEIEFPDVDAATAPEELTGRQPLTIENFDDYDFWDISLEEITRIALKNSDVIRTLGGRITDGGQGVATAIPETLTNNPNASVTTYDAALVETGNGTATGSAFSGTGVEAALAAFDAQLDANLLWQKNDRPQNFGGFGASIFATEFQQDLGTGTIGVTKVAADGTTFTTRSTTNYDANNNAGSRVQLSDWATNIEAGFSHPLLQGRGTQINRIMGPQTFQQAAGGFANSIDGVVIARIRHDVTLADFEQAVRDLMREVELAYWELYFTYRNLEAQKIGRSSALETWRVAKTNLDVGRGSSGDEAQARTQFFQFESQVQTALTQLLRVEGNLRYLMGLSPTDPRLMRPSDEPQIAQVHFDWPTIHAESLVRRAEIRQQKWNVKRRELEVIASRNLLLPRLDAVGTYRWVGGGDDLINSNGTGIPPFGEGSNAFESLTSGNYQEWELGLQLAMPLGFRGPMAGVRHHELLLARERKLLANLELEVRHQLTQAVRDIDRNYRIVGTNFNRVQATVDEVASIQALYDANQQRLDVLLQAQQRRAAAESDYYRSLVDFNISVMNVHYRKGSLLEYCGVRLAEGPWPNKAYFDALNRARRRDASHQINYGYTRPDVFSRGPHQQFETIPQGEYVEPLPLGTPNPAGNQLIEQSYNEPLAGDFGSLSTPAPLQQPNALHAQPLGPLGPLGETFTPSDYTQPMADAAVPTPMGASGPTPGFIETTPLAVPAIQQLPAQPVTLPPPSDAPANPFRTAPPAAEAATAAPLTSTAAPYESQPRYSTTAIAAAPSVR